MDLLGTQQPAQSWVDVHLDKLKDSEGEKGTDESIEAKTKTRGYGITLIPEPLKEIASRTTDDRKLAKMIINHNVGLMKQNDKLDFDNMPDSMKIAASDIMYNAGTLFNDFRESLENKDYPGALRNSLDIISANDPDADDESKVVRGLINRRRDMYNFAAEDLGLPQITDYSVLPSQMEGSLTDVTYNFGNAQDPIRFNINKGMHTKSITDERPQGYDVIDNAVSKPMLSEKPFEIFGTESLAYPGANTEILGSLPPLQDDINLLGR